MLPGAQRAHLESTEMLQVLLTLPISECASHVGGDGAGFYSFILRGFQLLGFPVFSFSFAPQCNLDVLWNSETDSHLHI